MVLLSGGVGLTPIISMLEHLVRGGDARPIWYIHGAENGRVHAMRSHVRTLARSLTAFEATTFYADPQTRDVAGADYDVRGLITPEWLLQAAPPGTTFYLCGPRPFLRALVRGLLDRGVPMERIRYEFFGPADELLEAPDDRLAAD